MLVAYDTATTTASVALYDLTDDTLLAEVTWLARRRHTQDLLVTTQTLLQGLALTPDAITALAVTTGPGSFTGVRIGLSVVKGMGVGLAAPPAVVGVPTLVVTAAPWLTAAQSAGAEVWALIQAGRGRYNWVRFEPDGDPLHTAWPGVDAHQAGTAADLAAAVAAQAGAPVWLVGEIGADLRAALTPLSHLTLMDTVSGLRRAGALAQVAARRMAAGAVDDLASLQPLYLQAPG